MTRKQCIAVAAVIVGTSSGVHVARAQQSGIKRTNLQQHDLGVAGREVVQVRIDFSPGVAFGLVEKGEAAGHDGRVSRRGSYEGVADTFVL